jgi:hypothetical protein
MTTAIERGRWYPSPAPALDGEDDDAYTNRLTGADRSGGYPYDHQRNRQCSIGWHMDCSGWRGPSGCYCPCHADRVSLSVTGYPGYLLTAASMLGRLYSLPQGTGLRVMLAAHGSPDRGKLKADLEAAYGCSQSDVFVTDVANVYQAAQKGEI